MKHLVKANVEKENSKENSKENNKEILADVLDILEEHPEISMKKISNELNVTTGKVRYYIDILKKSGMIEHKGSTKKGKWIVHK